MKRLFVLVLCLLLWAQGAEAQSIQGPQLTAWTQSLTIFTNDVITSYITKNPPPQGYSVGNIQTPGTQMYSWYITLLSEVTSSVTIYIQNNPPPQSGT